MKKPFKDLYQLLGVSSSASPQEVKSAYRQRVKQHHPDVKGGNAQDFQEIREAYEVLIDPGNRARYDRMYQQMRGQNQKHVRQEQVNRFWEEVRRQRSRYREQQEEKKESTASSPPPPVPGEDVTHNLEIPFKLSVLGGRVELDVHHLRKRLQVDIPAGVKTGTRIIMEGRGKPGRNGGRPGQLRITLQVAEHSRYQRDEMDLIYDATLNLAQAILGTRLKIRLLNDQTVTLTIPAGTQAGSRFRLAGLGVKRNGTQGDLLVVTRIVIPPVVSPKQKRMIEKFARDMGMKY